MRNEEGWRGGGKNLHNCFTPPTFLVGIRDTFSFVTAPVAQAKEGSHLYRAARQAKDITETSWKLRALAVNHNIIQPEVIT